MLSTWELRWFRQGTLPQDVENWFITDCPGKLFGTPEKREDFYLYIPECQYLNLKLRQGNLEMKWRKSEVGLEQFGEHGEGKVEKWSKWICQDPNQQTFIPVNAQNKKPWIRVKKIRSQRLYQDISVEITQLHTRNEFWWSMALERTCCENQQFDNFEHVLCEMSATYQGPQLLPRNSFAYPGWLTLLQKGKTLDEERE